MVGSNTKPNPPYPALPHRYKGVCYNLQVQEACVRFVLGCAGFSGRFASMRLHVLACCPLWPMAQDVLASLARDVLACCPLWPMARDVLAGFSGRFESMRLLSPLAVHCGPWPWMCWIQCPFCIDEIA